MPPRAVGRRASSRLPASSEPDDTLDSSPAAASAHLALSRPNLPKLAGTPASRRQYTYGSAAEPPPSRPGRGLRMDQPLDLANAVGNVLGRQEQEDRVSSRKQMPPPARPNPTVEDNDDSEYEEPQESEPEPEPRRSGRPKKPATRTASVLKYTDGNGNEQIRRFPRADPVKSQEPTRQQLEDMRDDRSFGTESDYYGNASIRSASPAQTPAAARSARKMAPKKTSNLRQGTPLEVVEEATIVIRQAAPAASPPREEPAKDPTPPPVPEPEPEPLPVPTTEGVAPLRQATRPEDTLSFRRLRTTTSQASIQPAPKQPSRPPSRPQRKGQATTTQFEPLHTTVEHDGATSHFRPARQLAPRQPGPKDSPGSLHNKVHGYTSNHSEADDAIQRDIAATSDAGENELSSPLKRAWDHLKNFSSPRDPPQRPYVPPNSLRPRGTTAAQPPSDRPSQRGSRPGRQSNLQPITPRVPAVSREEYRVLPVGNNETNWQRLLSPRTYIDFFFNIMDGISDRCELFMLAATSLFGSKRFWKRAGSVLATIIVGVLLIANASTFTDLFGSSISSKPSIPPPAFPFPSLSGMASKVGDFASSIHIPLPSFGRHEPSMWEGLDTSERGEVGAYLRKFDVDFKDLQSSSSLHGASIEKLEKLLPQIIHVKSPNGKVAIGTDFYYAIRDKLRDDETILTFDEKNGNYVVGSEKQWRSLVQGISNDPNLNKKLNLSMSSIESRLDGKMTSFWDSWIKDNDHKITAQLGTALESLKAANSEAELNAIVKKLVQDQIRDSSVDGGTLITRDDFIKQIHREMEVHRHEIRTELDDLQPQLKTLIQETVRLANTQHASPAGMTREDITTLVHTLIRKAIADTDLKAMAKGKIHAHWGADLKNQVNYFAMGGGAFAEPKLTSATYDPLRLGLASADAYAKGVRGAKPLPPAAALWKWDDEGDCWCAAREVNHRGNPHGATLSVLMAHQVIPQHIVIEHILPGATSDPGARPREMEVHIRIEDPEVLSRVKDFSATHFAEKIDDWNNTPAELGPRFVKVGQFTYEGAELHDGVHVQRLSRELVEMGAETDQVVVRAVSNYGAAEHTCLYRVRLYGERIGTDV